MSTLVSGFTVIPVAYAHSTHILYARAHLSKSLDVIHPEKRALFLVNTPALNVSFSVHSYVRRLFRGCGCSINAAAVVTLNLCCLPVVERPLSRGLSVPRATTSEVAPSLLLAGSDGRLSNSV
ncbi:hypothetical protein L210DRAFT_346320 [Boletus edulis BED1]|uniref:Uncharacterized protein n=1 Tax=Boletus edulis BED1 TaxID=1328754 RepID=A0AAD4BFZ0_BOLED|nr:hypothetical protein L210DRAFT_346320 [Boletus edulis BED1]